MGSLFRSEEMALCQLFLQSEAAYACVSELGELGLAQFRDLNPDVNAFQRKFVNEVRRCDEMERKLRYLEKEIKKDGIPIMDSGEIIEAPQPREMIDLEATFEKLENELREVNQNAEALKRNFLELTELKHILKKTQVFFDEMAADGSREDEQANLLGEEGLRTGGQSLKLGFVAGVILRERIPAFERMLWRACRGNVYLRQAEIDDPLCDPASGEQVFKSVFIIFFQGEQLKTRVKKICEGFRGTLYPCPETPLDRREMAVGVMTRIEDLNTVLNQTQDHRHRVLVAAAKNLKTWFTKVRKIKAIYHTLNLFNLDVTQKCLIAECWVPIADLESIHHALRRGTERSGSSVPPILNKMDTKETPPTYFRLNKFTKGFQALIDAYGVATYREANPTPFAIITFPFLFSVMFGDFGHGFIMTLFAMWMIVNEKPLMNKKFNSEIWNIFFAGKYIICLMGFFSMYTGLIYNDFFSKSLNIFGSEWFVPYTTMSVIREKEVMLDPKNAFTDEAYPLGLDPVWQVAENKIQFLNAYKMKVSIIVGVCHMLFGVMISLWNHMFFRRQINIICEFIPQIIFMTFLFFYLCLLVFHKWCSYSAVADAHGLKEEGAHCAPSILITFINMVLFKSSYPPNGEVPDCDPYMYSGQEGFQKFLVFIALMCVPWMLCGKPYLIWKERKLELLKANNGNAGGLMEETNASQAQMIDGSAGAVGTSHEHEEEFSDICIHQAIHTIEYVLGCVSNTASYLRLWALSLAHAQLSEVLWSMVMRIGLSQTSWYGGIVLWAIFAAWAVLTLGILILMEGLSAFLHTLRLHWVEFQNKFYQGQGYPFLPFSFEIILDAAQNTELD
ncbi:V-type proton ATPase 116 kDa subunit a1 isoform X3 [Folsomia candida]|uniref:V-type proton ATPase 116 kDa subunit a1 isoform X3 n=1 Tax=Folsomia candida TaxID=158441 RepID=UPI000B8EEED3|nr:V-type proton ATPase 116 kDa subunit a1 isoform X3 [Folsomia candida]